MTLSRLPRTPPRIVRPSAWFVNAASAGASMGFVRRHSSAAAVVASIVLALVALGASSGGTRARGHDTERHLFAGAGEQARTAPDALAAIDVDPDSPRAGQVVTTWRLPGPGATGNEPHVVEED